MCQEMRTERPLPTFLFVCSRVHLKLTLSVGGSGWMYTVWIERRLEIIMVVMLMVVVLVVVYTLLVCVCVFCMIVRTAVVLS